MQLTDLSTSPCLETGTSWHPSLDLLLLLSRRINHRILNSLPLLETIVGRGLSRSSDPFSVQLPRSAPFDSMLDERISTSFHPCLALPCLSALSRISPRQRLSHSSSPSIRRHIIPTFSIIPTFYILSANSIHPCFPFADQPTIRYIPSKHIPFLHF